MYVKWLMKLEVKIELIFKIFSLLLLRSDTCSVLYLYHNHISHLIDILLGLGLVHWKVKNVEC